MSRNMLLRSIRNAFIRRFRDKKRVEIDVSNLIRRYGQDAVERAMYYSAQGSAALQDGRRPGHWKRVARCIAGRPQAVRSDTVFG